MQNTLLLVTRNEILERMMLGMASSYDPTVLRAIEMYLNQHSIQQQAISFVRELAPIFEEREKENYIELFKKYLEIENGIETFSKKYTSHINHVIQEFLIGYNILHSGNLPLAMNEQSDINGEKFKELLFAWMIAALFHDTGYDVEKFEEEENFRKMKNEYWSFLTKRPVTSDGIQLNLKYDAISEIEEHIIHRYNSYFDQECNYHKFLKLFELNNSYDHAFVSGLKYFTQLVELQRNNGGNYLEWEPNYNAIFAMLLHNFKYKRSGLKLNAVNERHFLPYLLIICDEIEYWERNRVIDVVEKQNKVNIELDNASFKRDYCYFIINHSVVDAIDDYKEKLFNRIIESNTFYPINIIQSELIRKIYDDIEKNINKSIQTIFEREMITFLFEQKYRNFSEVATDQIFEIFKQKRKKKDADQILEKLNSNEKMLVPSGKYKIIIDHRVNQTPFLTYELNL